jgi:hypothetical protein
MVITSFFGRHLFKGCFFMSLWVIGLNGMEQESNVVREPSIERPTLPEGAGQEFGSGYAKKSSFKKLEEQRDRARKIDTCISRMNVFCAIGLLAGSALAVIGARTMNNKLFGVVVVGLCELYLSGNPCLIYSKSDSKLIRIELGGVPMETFIPTWPIRIGAQALGIAVGWAFANKLQTGNWR